MQFILNIEKKHFYLIVVMVALVGVVSFVQSQGATFGHLASQVSVDIDGSTTTLQAAIDDGDIGRVVLQRDILDTCQMCVRYADINGRASASWNCQDIDVPVNTNFVGDVNSDDDFDVKVDCTDNSVQTAFQFCKRYSDLNKRVMREWKCSDFGVNLNTDFVGDVNSDDDFDLVIKSKSNDYPILTSCGIAARYADGNGRLDAAWRYASIGKVLKTDFVGDVDSNDDFDLMLTCDIPFEDA